MKSAVNSKTNINSLGNYKPSYDKISLYLRQSQADALSYDPDNFDDLSVATSKRNTQYTHFSNVFFDETLDRSSLTGTKFRNNLSGLLNSLDAAEKNIKGSRETLTLSYYLDETDSRALTPDYAKSHELTRNDRSSWRSNTPPVLEASSPLTNAEILKEEMVLFKNNPPVYFFDTPHTSVMPQKDVCMKEPNPLADTKSIANEYSARLELLRKKADDHIRNLEQSSPNSETHSEIRYSTIASLYDQYNSVRAQRSAPDLTIARNNDKISSKKSEETISPKKKKGIVGKVKAKFATIAGKVGNLFGGKKKDDYEVKKKKLEEFKKQDEVLWEEFVRQIAEDKENKRVN